MKKNKNIEFTPAVRENFYDTLIKLMQILSKAGLNSQTQVIGNLINLLDQHNDCDFVKLLNGVHMWGGSGAVWEVYIEESQETKEFELEMIKLIDLMEENSVLGKGIKSIRKIFKENFEGDN